MLSDQKIIFYGSFFIRKITAKVLFDQDAPITGGAFTDIFPMGNDNGDVNLFVTLFFLVKSHKPVKARIMRSIVNRTGFAANIQFGENRIFAVTPEGFAAGSGTNRCMH